MKWVPLDCSRGAKLAFNLSNAENPGRHIRLMPKTILSLRNGNRNPAAYNFRGELNPLECSTGRVVGTPRFFYAL